MLADVCIAWHGQYRHWWITHCTTVGRNQGFAWLEEDARLETFFDEDVGLETFFYQDARGGNL